MPHLWLINRDLQIEIRWKRNLFHQSAKIEISQVQEKFKWKKVYKIIILFINLKKIHVLSYVKVVLFKIQFGYACFVKSGLKIILIVYVKINKLEFYFVINVIVVLW